MIEHFLKFLESYKEQKFSATCNNYRYLFLEKLHSAYPSSRIKPYFTNINWYDFELKTDQVVLEKNKLYITQVDENIFQYEVIGPDDQLIEDQLHLDEIDGLEVPNPITREWLNQRAIKEALLKITTHRHHTLDLEAGIPFTNYETEPKQIVIIKEIINALYLGEQALLDLESVHIHDGNDTDRLKDIWKLLTHAVDNGYQACLLSTHLDIDAFSIFAKELNLIKTHIIPVLLEFKKKHANDANSFVESLTRYPISHQAGVLSGIAVDQMKPDGDDFDYHFLANFGAVLPGYIETFTNYIQQYSPELTSFKPNLSQDEIENLQRKAGTLLHALENLQGSNFFMFAKVFYYIQILRSIIFLSMSILEQMSHLNDSSQEIVRNNMARLKYELLVPLFALVDRMEDEALLSPGTLSKPLMAAIKPFYTILIEYTGKFVNFSVTGQNLMAIEDNKFVEARLVETEQRMNREKQKLLEIQVAQNAFDHFFMILESHEHTKSYIVNLSSDTKNTLADYYKLFQSYLKQVDIDTNNDFINALNQEESPWWNKLNPKHWFGNSQENITTKRLTALKDKVQALIQRDIETQNFHLQLNQDLIESVYTQAELVLFPYPRENNIFIHDEAKILNVSADEGSEYHFGVMNNRDRLLLEVNILSSEQVFNLYQFYEEKLAKLTRAEQAFTEFMTILNAHNAGPLVTLPAETKKQLRKLYCLFQPYWIDAAFPNPATNAREHLVLEILSGKPNDALSEQAKRLTRSYFLNKRNSITNRIAIKREEWQQRSQVCRTEAEAKYRASLQETALEADYTNGNRIHHVIKHTNFSTIVREMRTSLFDFVDVFNKATKNELLHDSTNAFSEYEAELFPEIQDDDLPLTELDELEIEEAESDDSFSKTNVIAKLCFLAEHYRENNLEEALQLQQFIADAEQYQQLVSGFGPSSPIAPLLGNQLKNDYRRLLPLLRRDQDLLRALGDNLTPSLTIDTLLTEDDARKKAYRPLATRDLYNTHSLPYPELQNVHQSLEQGQQVVAIKRLFNALYHLEKICIDMEALNENSCRIDIVNKGLYVANLLHAKGQLDEISKIAQELYKSPFLNLLAEDIITKAKTLYEGITASSEPYRVSFEEVNTQPNEALKYSGLWYALNAFMLVPEHIKTLSSQTPLSVAELQAVQENTKRTVVKIEKLILSTDSFLYWKALFKTPMMFKLFSELREKLDEFTTLSHDAVLDHIEDINTNLFPRILIETDKWEDRFALAPGKLSGSMKLLLDEFYKGLLEPLGFQSQRHIELVSKMEPITKRFDDVRMREQAAREEKEKYLAYCNTLEKFIDKAYKVPLVSGIHGQNIQENFVNTFGPHTVFAEITKEELIEDFADIIPLFEENSAVLASMPAELKKSTHFDTLIGLRFDNSNAQERLEPEESDNLELEEAQRDTFVATHIMAKFRFLLNHYEQNNQYDEETQGRMREFINDAEAYKHFTSGNQSRHLAPLLEERLKKNYFTLLPLLREERERFNNLSDKMELSPAIDKLLADAVADSENQETFYDVMDSPEFVIDMANNEIPEAEEADHLHHTRHIMAKCRWLLSYFKGLTKTYQLAEETAKEKITYLEQLHRQQRVLNKQFVVSYTQKTFEKHLEIALNRHIGLRHLEKEYNNKLTAYFVPHQKSIINTAKSSPDIEKRVQGLVAEELTLFDYANYKNYIYLEQIMDSITQFDSYLSHATIELQTGKAIFENANTLTHKTQVIRKLKEIAMDPEKTVDQRLKEMQEITSDYNQFEKVMLTHAKPNEFTFAWLCQIVSNILQFLHFFKPKYVKRYEDLNVAIKTEPNESSLRRFSIFASNEQQPVRNYGLPDAAAPIVAVPV